LRSFYHQVYAKDKGPAGALEYERENWGTGSNVTTTLISPAGEVSKETANGYPDGWLLIA